MRIYRLTGLHPGYQARLRAAQMEAARVWTLCRDLHLAARRNPTPWPTQDEFQQATKGRFALHSQTIQAIFRAFLGTIDTTRELRKTNRRIRYPYKDKRYYFMLSDTENPCRFDNPDNGLNTGKGLESCIQCRCAASAYVSKAFFRTQTAHASVLHCCANPPDLLRCRTVVEHGQPSARIWLSQVRHG